MYKNFAGALAAIAMATPAFADNLPPPPTEVYTPSTAQSCTPFKMQVYFQSGETVLSQHALNTISATRDQVSECAIAELKLVSLAADDEANSKTAELATERLTLVRAALKAEGMESEDVSAEIVVTPATYKTNQPMARRVEVMVAAYRPEIG